MRSDLPESRGWLRRLAPTGELRGGVIWLALGFVGALPLVLALELALVLLALAGFPVLEHLLPSRWLALLAAVS